MLFLHADTFIAEITSPVVVGVVVAVALVLRLVWRCGKLRKEEAERKLPDNPYQRLLSVVSVTVEAEVLDSDEKGAKDEMLLRGDTPRASDASSQMPADRGKKGKGKVGRGLADHVGQSLIEMRQVGGAKILCVRS